ncbi:NADP-dependent 3-hydroxy acid dehydrogenase YdfG [Arthrobacter sp. UYP6]|uniref:SDR family oxidoreductase n=1 Tax=Arthrobacter sp. UYP6 TaxID=1756378 RepID=UPI0033997068
MTPQAPTGRVAVITGASSGIGAATARALSAAGYRLALLARRIDRLEALAAELGDGVVPLQADVTRRPDVAAAAQRVKNELGGADVLVNNAGVMLLGDFGPDRDSDYPKMVNVNLLGAITATEVFLDQLRDGGGDLVNVSSVAGRTARPGDAVYAATKWGLIGFSECLRQELLPDVRVTVIEPGFVATDLPTHITDPKARQAAEELYSHVTLTPEDIAAVIEFTLAQPRRIAINEVVVRSSNQQH